MNVQRLSRSVSHLLWATPLLIIFAIWEVVGKSDKDFAFFFSFPSAILYDLVYGIAYDGLLWDALYTLIPAVLGLLLGCIAGGVAGFLLVSAPIVAGRVGPVISFLGAFPVFAIAPMTLVWFGLGISAKVFLAFIGCVFVFLQAAFNGGVSVPIQLIQHFRVHGFSQNSELTKLRFPFAIDWLLAAFKVSANLALLGVFVGEFIASQHGLARVMLNAGALYDVKRVLAAAVLFTAVAVGLMAVADLVGKYRSSLLRVISVPTSVRQKRGA